MIKLYPLGTVHAPCDAYDSSKIIIKKKSTFRSHLTNNEGVFPFIFQERWFFYHHYLEDHDKLLNIVLDLQI
jgi:hypothetical protein